jgi:sugar O-acyltransferase (sialic acid O-acetyltransferase NeuD family)
MRKLYVIGSSGFAKQTAQLALRSAGSRWEFAGYISQDRSEIGKELPYGRIVGDDTWLMALDEPSAVAIGVGYPKIRRAIALRFQTNDRLSFPNLIHPSVEVDDMWVRLGRGNAIYEGCVLSCEISIRDFCSFNKNVTISHYCTIGSYNVVNTSANIAGHVQLGDEILVGTGAQILPRINVTSRAVVGAGAVVEHNIVEEGIYTGMPARLVIRSIGEEGGTYVGVPARRR